MEVTYVFNEDGTFTMDRVFNGKALPTSRGTWAYKITTNYGGDLTLNNVAQPHYGVFWYDRDCAVIQVANVNVAKDWRLKWAVKQFDSTYSHKVWYERDDSLNDHIVVHHVSSFKGYRQEELWTPLRCKRIAANNSPSLKKVVSTQSTHLKQSELGGKPPYRIVDLVREKDSDFAYAFTLELSGDASIQTFFGVQTVFANEVRAAYQTENPNADVSALRVVVQPQLSNGKIIGRAEVLTITPVSLSYDAGTRRGKLSVRFNPGQAEEARAWIRKNIETLARDKNIAVTTGQTPPAATYYSLGERIEGNVMEIEFKTE